MISFDRGGSNANLNPIYNSISILSSEIQDVYDSLSALPTDITSMMSLVASLTSNITELNDNTSQLADNFSNYLPIISSFNTSVLNNYELTSNAFNSSVLTDYAKTSDIPTNTGGGGENYLDNYSGITDKFKYNITGSITSFDKSNIVLNGYDLTISTLNLNISDSYLITKINGVSSFINNSFDSIYTLLMNGRDIKSNSFNSGKNYGIDCFEMSSNTLYKINNMNLNGYTVEKNIFTYDTYLKINGEYIRSNTFTSQVCLNNTFATMYSNSIVHVSDLYGNGNVFSRNTIEEISNGNILASRVESNQFSTVRGVLRLTDYANAYNSYNNITKLEIDNYSANNNSLFEVYNFDLKCVSAEKNTFRNVSSANVDAYYITSLSASSFRTLNIDCRIISTCKLDTIQQLNITANKISSLTCTNIDNLNVYCYDSCEKNGYSSILGDIHLSGHSFNSNTYSSFMGNLNVNCDIFGDYIEHKVSVSNWDFSDLDNNWFNITASDYFGNVGGVKNVNISALTFEGNVGAIENLNITAPLCTGQDQMVGLKNANINCGTCYSLIFLGNTDLNLNITISDKLYDIAPEGRMTLDLRNHETSSPGNIGIFSDNFKYLELKMPESAKKDFTQLFNKDNYHTSSLWKTVSINMLNYIPKSDWMSYNTDLINSNICSWCGMPVSLLN